MNYLYASLILSGIAITIASIYQSKKGNSFDITYYLFPLGIFVWGDGIVFGPLWTLAGILFGLIDDPIGLFLFISIFWVVRSAGETIYWLNEQFVKDHRNDYRKMLGYSLVENESVYFLHQIICQSILVISIMSTIYFAHLWLS